jgi:hypothetical protein
MMDHINLLKRAWKILWSYRALWVIGVILALTTASPMSRNASNWTNSGGNNNNQDTGFEMQAPEALKDEFAEIGNLFAGDIDSEALSLIIGISIAVACIILFLVVLSNVARFVSETAAIKMVDSYEETGEKMTVQQGLRTGWSRTAWRLFLITLIIKLPTIIFLLMLLIVGLLVFFGVSSGMTVLGVTSIVAAIGIFFLCLFLFIILNAVLKLLQHFFLRTCALEEVGVIGSIRLGFALVRRHLLDVGILWLIVFGVQIAYAIALIPISLLMIPIFLLLLIPAILVGAIPALLIGGLSGLIFGMVPGIIIGAVIGTPLFFLVAISPWIFVGGLMQAFKSTIWTLAYRELDILDNIEEMVLEELPEVDLNQALDLD